MAKDGKAKKKKQQQKKKKNQSNSFSSAKSAKTAKGKGPAIPSKHLEKQTSATLRALVDKKMPHWENAQSILDKRKDQTRRARGKNKDTLAQL